MIGNPSAERRPIPHLPLPENRFTNPVVPPTYTEGVKPNLGYVYSSFFKHPDFSHAVELLVEKWWDKQPSPLSNKTYLYSHGKRVAFVTPPEGKQPIRLDILVDLDQHKDHEDQNWNLFEKLILANLALYAGSQEKTTNHDTEYALPPFTTTIPADHFSPDVIYQLSNHWQGTEEIVYTIKTDQQGNTYKRRHGTFDLIDGNDKELRLNIIATEKILKLDNKEIARITTRYVPQRSNEIMFENDHSPIPLPVISSPEVIITGNSQEERYQNLEYIINLLTTYQHQEDHPTEMAEKNVAGTPRETTVFSITSAAQEQPLAAD